MHNIRWFENTRKDSYRWKTIQVLEVRQEVQSIGGFEKTWKNAHEVDTILLFNVRIKIQVCIEIKVTSNNQHRWDTFIYSQWDLKCTQPRQFEEKWKKPETKRRWNNHTAAPSLKSYFHNSQNTKTNEKIPTVRNHSDAPSVNSRYAKINRILHSMLGFRKLEI